MPVTWLRRHAFSYGTYFYGFPVQQILIALGVREPTFLLACCVPVTLCCAALSWHLIARPALHQKERVGDWIKRWFPGDDRGG